MPVDKVPGSGMALRKGDFPHNRLTRSALSEFFRVDQTECTHKGVMRDNSLKPLHAVSVLVEVGL